MSHQPGSPPTTDAGTRLREQRGRLTVTALGSLRHILDDVGIDTVQCFGTIAEALTAALTRSAPVVEMVPPLPRRDRTTPPCRRPVSARRPTQSIG
ncbi:MULTISPECIES: hypothetical protein [Rhodococcus]|uniref:Uncharacterized protein n=1 Tax=Rhodococcus opacus RKJ300 = JCM 13270 TaxID=1165867 RepID=I0WU22_RHOOP|nr:MULTISPECIES: hypothetical protein [Rhodococcus]EID79888.1 hypothetical protein W59_11196 [Rhodococcus opacus RKJ300 = JCM 13270]KAF0959246.1 hypothetical protein MLGJGCBP_07680 [Rhodococcus sp. T7]QQZ18203.1 hypothetical protein GO592_38725 [Rhodococcus sp. 21391]UOT08122.1 hypothetical protein MPY17_37810 [Rhodococcus opacus]